MAVCCVRRILATRLSDGLGVDTRSVHDLVPHGQVHLALVEQADAIPERLLGHQEGVGERIGPEEPIVLVFIARVPDACDAHRDLGRLALAERAAAIEQDVSFTGLQPQLGGQLVVGQHLDRAVVGRRGRIGEPALEQIDVGRQVVDRGQVDPFQRLLVAAVGRRVVVVEGELVGREIADAQLLGQSPDPPPSDS